MIFLLRRQKQLYTSLLIILLLVLFARNVSAEIKTFYIKDKSIFVESDIYNRNSFYEIKVENNSVISKTQNNDKPRNMIGIDFITIYGNLSIAGSSGASLQYGHFLSKNYMLTISYMDFRTKFDDIDVSRKTALLGFKKFWQNTESLGWYYYGGMGYTDFAVNVGHDNTRDKISSVNYALGTGYFWEKGSPDLSIGILGGTGKQREWVSSEGNKSHFYPTIPMFSLFLNIAF